MGLHESKAGSLVVRMLNSEGFRRVARTFLWAFLGLLIPGLLGWLNGLTEWASSEGQAPLPDARSLAYLGVAAIGAGVIAVVNGIAVIVEQTSGHALLREVPKRPKRGESGVTSVVAIIGVAAVLFAAAILVLLL